MFQPPHPPESNPIEQVWKHLKRGLKWTLYACLNEMNEKVIASILGRSYILYALSVVRI
jgi:transposase